MHEDRDDAPRYSPWWKTDAEGRPVPATREEGRALIEDGEARQVGLDQVGGITVSTVFLVIDQDPSPAAGGPILWETMVFGAAREYQERYGSLAGARAGHARAVEMARRGDFDRAPGDDGSPD